MSLFRDIYDHSFENSRNRISDRIKDSDKNSHSKSMAHLVSDLAIRRERIEQLQNLASNGSKKHKGHLPKQMKLKVQNTRFTPNKVKFVVSSLLYLYII